MMKTVIKVKLFIPVCEPTINPKGDWIDLRAAKSMSIPAVQADTLKRKITCGEEKRTREVNIPVYYIPLGVAIKLPKGYEAVLNSRSSGPKKLGLFIPNGQGVIDNTYNGNKDEWCYVASPMYDTKIKCGDRICQFRIQLSQHATVWQKIKWLFSSGVKIQIVDDLGDNNRGGFGSTGVK